MEQKGRAMPAPAKNLPAKLSVDFTGVEIRKGGDYIPPGDYLTRVVDANVRSKKDDPQAKYISWLLEVQEPSKYTKKRVYMTTSLKKEALWKLRSFLVDILGAEKVPAKALDLPLAKIVAIKPWVGISTEDDEYNGKTKTNVSGTFSRADWTALSATAEADDEEEDEVATPVAVEADDEEEEEAPKPKKSKVPEPAAEEEGEDMEELELDDL